MNQRLMTSRLRARPARRGAAMIETILTLPIILVMIALMFYFGLAMVRFSQATQMDRYEAWRVARMGTGPQVSGDNITIALDDTFFANDPSERITVNALGGWPQAPHLQSMVQQVGNIQPVYGQYFQALLDDKPANIVASFTVTHSPNNPIARLMNRDLTHRHVVSGNAWWFAHPATGQRRQHHAHLIRDFYFADLDQFMTPLANRGNRWAEILQNFYLNRPGYQGPDLPDWIAPPPDDSEADG